MAEYYFALTDIIKAIDNLVAASPSTFYNGLLAARYIFSKDLAADVAPVRHGRWIETTQPLGWQDETCAECSVCGEDFVLDEWGMDDMTNLIHYCPNCGARMDGEE